MRFHRKLGTEMGVWPVCVVLAGIDQRDVEGAEALADLLQVLMEAGVA